MAKTWTGIRRPVEDAVLRRAERKKDAPPQWWQQWNSLGSDWAREKAEEDAKAQRLLRVLMAGSNDDDDDKKARRLAEALGLKDALKNGGDR
jgi:hypothetical protein